MKTIKFFILSLFLTCHYTMMSEVLLNENDSIKIDSTYVRYFYNDFNNFTLGNIYEIDTSSITASYYDILDDPYTLYQTLSNAGLAHKKINFLYPISLGFNSNLESFSKFIRDADDIRYPIIYQPFTEISYMMGAKKEQYLEILFAREFFPGLFISLNYDIDFSPGVYKRSKAQNTHFNGNLRYNTKNDRYGLNTYYFHNKIDVQENGGIKNDSVFINNIEIDRSIIDVNLSNATNLIKISGFGIDQFFNILAPKSENVNDSALRKRNIDIGRINYHFDYQSNKYIYSDKDPLSTFYKEFDIVIDSTKTFDSVHFHTIRNVLYWNTLGYKKYSNDIPFYLTFGIEHNYTRHAGYMDLSSGERFNEQELSNLRAKAGIIVNIFKSTRISGDAQIITNGYQAGDFYIYGQWKQYLGTYKKNYGALKFDININRQSADWFEEYYYSNNFRWDNKFSPATSLFIQGSYELPFLSIGIKQTTIDNYIYFGTDAKPNQHRGSINVRSLYSTFNVCFNKFEFIGFFTLQTTDNDEVIHIPSFEGKMKLGYSIPLVKNISSLQPSIIINYFTKYYADAYMPSLRTFYLQNEIEVGNYPYIDLCITFKIKRANIYAQYTNMYSLTKDNRYISTPHYPMRDSRFCFGVIWRLYK